VPDYTLKVVDRGDTVWSTRIVAGKPASDHQTPLITQTMKFITVNPTWNVPPSIIRNEYLPALQRDPNALARLGLQVGRNKDGSIRIYQPPGAKNALGRIRFNFPNKFLVYQHDTPQKHLFEKQARAFSHGCMRVQNPEQYAQVLLSLSQPEENYTAARIRNMYGSDERTINFKRPIPVYVTYQTAFVDDAGKLQTRADVYGHDKAITRVLTDERQVADIPIKRDYTSSSKPVMARLPSRDTGARQARYGRDARDSWAADTSQNWNGFQGWSTHQAPPRGRHFSMW
jgi:L,D-transpeptidase YcbB